VERSPALRRREVGGVAKRDPFPLTGVPPRVALALGPRPALRVRRGAVVDDPDVLRPRPPPLVGDPVLLGVRPAARRLVDAVLVDPAVDPRSARCPTIRLQIVVAGEERAVGAPAGDLLQDVLGVRLALRALERVVPREVEDRPVARVGRSGELLPDPRAEVVDPVELRARIALGLDRLVVPLEQPLRVRERAVLLGVCGRRQEEHLGRDVLSARLARLVLGRVPPEQRGLVGMKVADDEPVEPAQSAADEA
jgi:hypothetical protein